MKGYWHRVSILVTHTDTDVDDELIADAQHWFGREVRLEAFEHHVEIVQRDRCERPIMWRVSAWVRPVSQRPRVVSLSAERRRLAG